MVQWLSMLKKSQKSFDEKIKGLIGKFENRLKTEAVKEHNERTPRLTKHIEALTIWHKSKIEYLNGNLKSANQKGKLQKELISINLTRSRFEEYVRSQYEVELKVPFVRVVVAFIPDSGGWT